MYMAEVLRLQGKGFYTEARLEDVVRPQRQEDFDPDEVAAGVIERAGLVIEDESA